MGRKFVLALLVAAIGWSACACGVPVKHYLPLACAEYKSWRFRATYTGLVKDIPYAPGAKDGQKLDVYKTDREGLSPVVIFFHGGSWSSGNRREYAELGDTLYREGFVTVIAEYRLYPDIRYPAFMEDAVAAVNWVRAHIKEYGGDPDRIILAGHSAGGHIVALLLTHDKFRKELTFDPMRIRGAVCMSGGYDLIHGLSVDKKLIRNVMDSDENWVDAQPTRHLRADVPPMLIVNGDLDDITYDEYAEKFATAMRGAGADVRYERIVGGDHFTVVLDMLPYRKGETCRQFMKFAKEVTAKDAAPAPDSAK
jgi:acetyl esterase/lipase